MRYPFALLIVGLGLTSMHAAAQTPAPLAGKAVVVVGSVEARRNGEAVSVASGNDVAEGTTIETSQGAHVYIVTADKGFISVRPNSSVTIERYRYDAANPEKTEIKIVLNRGVVRSISGSGAQAAKENYRMNTPVVALGIRGTDFSVFADATTTRAEVRMGGIVLTPFGEDCSPGGSGPCEGPRAAQLFTGEPNVLLQFKQGDPKPVALDTRFSYLRPDRMEPPASGEAGNSGATTTPSNAPNTTTAPGGVTKGELEFTEPPLPPITHPEPTPTPPVVEPPVKEEGPQIFWGRWGKIANLPPGTTEEELQQKASERVYKNGQYAIYRIPNANMVMPVSGRFEFNLTAAEAWIVNRDNNTATQAQVLNPTLSIDFGQKSFETHLDLQSGSKTYEFNAKGTVTNDGKLSMNQMSSDKVFGAVGGSDAKQAGYIFTKPIDGTTSATGATSWSRP